MDGTPESVCHKLHKDVGKWSVWDLKFVDLILTVLVVNTDDRMPGYS
jgi:hypothetical protein